MVAVPLKLGSGINVTTEPALDQLPALAGDASPVFRLVKLMVDVLGPSLLITSMLTGVPGGQVPEITALSLDTTGDTGGGRIVIGKDIKLVRPQLSVTVQVTIWAPAVPAGVKLVLVAVGVEKLPPQDAVH